MYYDFECIMKNKKHIPIACGLYIKSDYPDILEDKYENYSGEDIVDWFISRVNYFNINIPLNEDTITPPTTECFYCRDIRVYIRVSIVENFG